MKPVNKVIKILILSDVALIAGLGFVAPIFAVFLTNQIKGGNLEVVGYAAAIYCIVRSLVVVPIGQYLDKNHGEKDDLWFIIIGNVLAALAVFGYLFSRLPWHIYLLQAVYALGMGMNIPGYTAIFTRHIDKGREAFGWSVRAALIGIGTGVTGALGGIVANRFGFNTLFIGVVIFILLSAFLPLLISKEMLPKDRKTPKMPGIKTIHQPSAPKE
ncbi:MAG: MFS transporter [Candidatus Portnoybacteria bacterium]|nr:MFS transporter [Candidatus Portnoybacteria bacterium]